MAEVAVASVEVEAQEDPQTKQKEAMTMVTLVHHSPFKFNMVAIVEQPMRSK